MAKKSGTQAPRLEALRFGELEASTGDELDAHGSFENLRISGADLGGRDLSGMVLRESVLDDVQAHETVFRGSTFSEVELTKFNAPVLTAPRVQWRDVTLSASRLGSAEMYEASFNSVRISGSKIGFINARGSNMLDVLFEDCSLDELDLSGSTLTRVAFVNTTVRSISLEHTKLTNVDLRGADFSQIDGYSALRGATLSSYQVSMLASSFASHLGVIVED